jgi:hypothetical protein
MTSLVYSIRRRTLVFGLVVASFAGASGSAYAAPAVVQLGDGPPSAKIRTVAKVPKRPKVVVERTVVRCDVPVGAAHADDLWRCE